MSDIFFSGANIHIYVHALNINLFQQSLNYDLTSSKPDNYHIQCIKLELHSFPIQFKVRKFTLPLI